jgi:predicted RNA-binding Zn-ribbon protein involved in translation (DUF1610 family)
MKEVISVTEAKCPSCGYTDFGNNEGVDLSDNPKYKYQFYYKCPKCGQKIKMYYKLR